MTTSPPISLSRIYWTAFIGLFFDYYDFYLFIYLQKTLAAEFSLTTAQSDWLQVAGFSGVGVGALVFGYLADRFGRGRMMLAVFAVYTVGIAGVSLAGSFSVLLAARLVASLALGAEWGISHTFLAERVTGAQRYRLAAWLQFSILGGLLSALMTKYALPVCGWRLLFAASIVPVVILSWVRWRVLAQADVVEKTERGGLMKAVRENAGVFALCLGIASLTIASGSINVFFSKELPQTVWYKAAFWIAVAPGMLLGAWLVRKLGVGGALALYAVAVVTLSLFAWSSAWPQRMLAFALILPVLNGIPFGLMGAFFNEVFGTYRTMLSGAAYNLGRVLAGFSPALMTGLGLHQGGRYFLFTATIGAGVLVLGLLVKAGYLRKTPDVPA